MRDEESWEERRGLAATEPARPLQENPSLPHNPSPSRTRTIPKGGATVQARRLFALTKNWEVLTVNKGTGKSARRTRRNNPGEAGDSVRDYRYDESKRLHNPPAGLTGQKPTMAAEGPPQVSYDPHKPPVLRFDPSGAVDRKHKGHESLPFEPGEHWAVAVKVIDLRGNEVMRVLRFPESESGAST